MPWFYQLGNHRRGPLCSRLTDWKSRDKIIAPQVSSFRSASDPGWYSKLLPQKSDHASSDFTPDWTVGRYADVVGATPLLGGVGLVMLHR